MTNKRMKNPEWDDARSVWTAGKVDIPPSRDDKCNHFLWDLKSAASMFTEAKRVTVADQDREWRRQPQCDSY